MNEKFAHTAGPWLAVKYTKTKFGLGNPGDSAWMMLAPVYTDTSDEEMRANARLISAAPELLEALQWLMASRNASGTPARIEAEGKALAALSKATGKTSEAA